MFTGIIEGLGTIAGISPQGQGKRIKVISDFDLTGSKIGDSIAVNGACLTAVTIDTKSFEADLSPETVTMTTFNRISNGDRVNLERALRFSDRLDGHLVSGHIDGTGIITDRKKSDAAVIITIEAPESLSRYFIQKGSVAIDGVSLTINRCLNNRFEVSIIPHTSKLTTITSRNIKDSVNIETDIIGKYVERFTNITGDETGKTNKSAIDMEFLAKSGFL